MKSRKETTGLQRLNALAAIARHESAPVVDVADDVLYRLRNLSVRVTYDRSLMWLTVGAVAAAAIVLVISMPYFTTAFDPLTTFFETAAESPI